MAGVTQKQIAEMAGVTPEMVSRALSDRSSVSPRKRAQIREVARLAGYQPEGNHSARSMAAKRHGKRIHTDVIAIVTSAKFFSDQAFLRLPYFLPFLQGIETVAVENCLDVCHFSLSEGRFPRPLLRDDVDGVISLAENHHQLEGLSVPVVHLAGPDNMGAVRLLPDNEGGTALATRHLIELGHRKIAYLGFSPQSGLEQWTSSGTNREAGYRSALNEAGLNAELGMIVRRGTPRVDDGYKAVHELLNSGARFSAMVCYNDLMALGAVHGLQECGFNVPEDVSVTGFDDVSQHYGATPPITSVGYDRHAMGRRAVEIILSLRNNGGTDESVKFSEHFATKLVPKDSTSQPGTGNHNSLEMDRQL